MNEETTEPVEKEYRIKLTEEEYILLVNGINSMRQSTAVRNIEAEDPLVGEAWKKVSDKYTKVVEKLRASEITAR